MVGSEPFALDSSGPKHFHWLSLLSYVHVFIGLHLHFFKGAIARNGAIVIVLVFLIAKRIAVTAERLLPSLEMTARLFWTRVFTRLCIAPNRPSDAAVTQIDRYFQNQIRFGAVCWS